MRQRFWEWSAIITVMLSTGLAGLWIESVLTKRHADVLTISDRVNLLIADGRLMIFGDLRDRARSFAGTFRHRALGTLGLPKEHAYFDWVIPALGARYCLITGKVAFPLAPGMGPQTIRYVELAIPGLSYQRVQESQRAASRWIFGISLVVPLVLSLAFFAYSWHRLGKARRAATSCPIAVEA
jgi:hypothetical protein